MKATAVSPSNIAFIKYWGKKNETLRLPDNGSISMNLSEMTTTTTVEFDNSYQKDTIEIDGKREEKEAERVSKHLDRIRSLVHISAKARVVSRNSFPSGTGLSSSSSGFAALTVAAVAATRTYLTEKELSILARQGSGSACRSIPDGFVEWLDGDTSEESYAVSLYPAEYWNICDVVVFTSSEKKLVSSTKGQLSAKTSEFFPVRQAHMGQRITKMKRYISEKKFREFGELVELEALELHAIMLTSQPSLLYFLPNTIYAMRKIQALRENGLPVYFTLNTGQDVHLIIERENIRQLLNVLQKDPILQSFRVNNPAQGAHLVKEHLF